MWHCPSHCVWAHGPLNTVCGAAAAAAAAAGVAEAAAAAARRPQRAALTDSFREPEHDLGADMLLRYPR